MTIENITHACGHAESHQLYGPGRNRERKAEKLAETICHDCWQAAQTTADAAYPFAALVGTPKQLAWAERSRAQLRRLFDAYLAALTPGPTAYRMRGAKRTDPELAALLRAEVGPRLFANPDAGWWIDHRDGERGDLYQARQIGYDFTPGWDQHAHMDGLLWEWLDERLNTARMDLALGTNSLATVTDFTWLGEAMDRLEACMPEPPPFDPVREVLLTAINPTEKRMRWLREQGATRRLHEELAKHDF